MRLGILTAAIPSVPTHFETRPGPYALLLSSTTDAVIRVGRLGNLRIQPGFYVYVGKRTREAYAPVWLTRCATPNTLTGTS